ncbi:Glutamyl-tRNA(Gln) amidotransferase subunit B, mitochondrial [Nakaseomyces bracarensis]|uniref:Glutamyl-tRNA(Gln) amidotransferase subunit B, mitochondrial n=1 Tax=Nakaseomyces bracarensis TaxID=273131 RepID=A0ABR4NNE2_9SACH
MYRAVLSRSQWRNASTLSKNKFALDDRYKLKCGLEIHTQLNTKHKLFSFSENRAEDLATPPNKATSHYDLALPGTQPRLNYEAVLYAAKLATALNSDINLVSQFDRKHYFYGDQPQGYQVTQHYQPFAKNGYLRLFGNYEDIKDKEKIINIEQIQIEQDTGKSHYSGSSEENHSLIDLNRSNVPLIELVTKPDFNDLLQIRAFIKKYQDLVRRLEISTGNLESGSMRVDVNISVNDNARIELKNLPNTSSIMNAVKYEYMRQVNIIEKGLEKIELRNSETRGWTGSETVKLRSKETTIDYRYMPDPELPHITLSSEVISKVSDSLPKFSDELLQELMSKPYNLSLKNAKILCISGNQNEMYDHEELRQFYKDVCNRFSAQYASEGLKLPSNWIIHEFLGNLNKLQVRLSTVSKILTPQIFNELVVLIKERKITGSSGKLLLFYIIDSIKNGTIMSTQKLNLEKLVTEHELEAVQTIGNDELEAICQSILAELTDKSFLSNLISGKKKSSLKYLVGQGMRLSQGRLNPQNLEDTFKKILDIKW